MNPTLYEDSFVESRTSFKNRFSMKKKSRQVLQCDQYNNQLYYQSNVITQSYSEPPPPNSTVHQINAVNEDYSSTKQSYINQTASRTQPANPHYYPPVPSAIPLAVPVATQVPPLPTAVPVATPVATAVCPTGARVLDIRLV